MKKFINILFKIFNTLIPNKYLRAKLKADWTKNYIKKYVLLADKNYIPKKEPYENNPPVYQYWEQGFDCAPELVKICVNSFDKFEPNRKHILLDKNNLENYIELPSFIYDLKKKGKIPLAQFSDIVRSALLGSVPCIWADATILLTGKLPEYITANDFFMYKEFQDTPEKFAGANYFIYSKTPNKMLVGLKDSILNYWKDNDFLISYFTHPHFISLLSKLNKDIWDKIPPYDEMLTLYLGFELYHKFEREKFEKIIQNCPVHKLSYKLPKKYKEIKEKTFLDIIKENYHA